MEIRVVGVKWPQGSHLMLAIGETVDQEALKLLTKEELVNLIRSCYNVTRRAKEAKERLR